MDGRAIILADGTKLPGSECGLAEGVLWCFVDGLTMMQAFSLLADPNKTQVITFQYGEMQDTFEGYTQLIAAILAQDGKIHVALREGE